MRYFLFIIIILGVFSCQNSIHNDKYVQELPDSIMINNVISCVIQYDSLRLDYGISETIHKIVIYKPIKWDNDSVPPPPPPPSAISFDKLFSDFESLDNSNKRIDDSIFFIVQSDTIRKYKISNKTCSRFSRSSDTYYLFYVPIYSYDKQFVFVQYWMHCGALCGHCRGMILKKTGKDWIKINVWGCGIS